MFRYEIILYWSNEDGAFVAEAVELPGCMANGADQETALRNIKDAMRFWVYRAREVGEAHTGAQGRAPHARLTDHMRPHTIPRGFALDANPPVEVRRNEGGIATSMPRGKAWRPLNDRGRV